MLRGRENEMTETLIKAMRNYAVKAFYGASRRSRCPPDLYNYDLATSVSSLCLYSWLLPLSVFSMYFQVVRFSNANNTSQQFGHGFWKARKD